MWAVVLAGGQGTRLRPAVSDVPKPLAPIRGRPFLAYLLDHLAANGITDVVLATGYLGEKIADAFGERHGPLALHYSFEREPLGTGGALKQALARVPRFPAFCLNGDTFAGVDLRAMLDAHRSAQATLTISVRRMSSTGRYGRVVVAEGRITAFAPAGGEEPGLINSGIYIFGENLLSRAQIPEKFSFEKDFLEPQVRLLAPLAYEDNGYFIDIGIPDDYRRAQTELATPPA
jgi:D-glycero-alpha-D-manno-heptose 1-phosphate guanylyltransferase